MEEKVTIDKLCWGKCGTTGRNRTSRVSSLMINYKWSWNEWCFQALACGLWVLCIKLHEVCLPWTHMGKARSLSWKAHKLKELYYPLCCSPGRIQDHIHARLRFCLFMQPASGGRETAISRALKSSIFPCDWTSFSSAAPPPPPPPRVSAAPVHLAEQLC